MTISSTVTCDSCKRSSPHSDSSKWIALWDKSRFDLCDGCMARLMQWLLGLANPDAKIPFRGSVTDLATDVAFELTAEQGKELIAELERFAIVEPTKFKS